MALSHTGGVSDFLIPSPSGVPNGYSPQTLNGEYVLVAGGSGGGTVTTNATLLGDGSSGNPLRIDVEHANDWTVRIGINVANQAVTSASTQSFSWSSSEITPDAGWDSATSIDIYVYSYTTYLGFTVYDDVGGFYNNTTGGLSGDGSTWRIDASWTLDPSVTGYIVYVSSIGAWFDAGYTSSVTFVPADVVNGGAPTLSPTSLPIQASQLNIGNEADEAGFAVKIAGNVLLTPNTTLESAFQTPLLTLRGNLNLANETANTIASFDGSTNIKSLDTGTYPSLGELINLKGVTSSIQTQFSGKQDTLVSGTNIKTINGSSLLGSGDLVISSGVISVSGTTSRITSTGGATPVIDISSSYVGQTSITTLGTIATGVWKATAIANNKLANSTISGVALGGTLGALTATNTTLTFSGSYDGSIARTVALNTGNANTWTGQQIFNTTAPQVGTATASTIAGFDASKNLVTLATATYPSLTELSYVKGVTSAIQTQLNSKGTFTLPSLTSGSVLFSNGTTIVQDNANFFWDGTNHRLGLGVNSGLTELVNISGNIIFPHVAAATRTITLATPTTSTAGNNLTIKSAAGFSGAGKSDAGVLTLAASAAGNNTTNGGVGAGFGGGVIINAGAGGIQNGVGSGVNFSGTGGGINLNGGVGGDASGDLDLNIAGDGGSVTIIAGSGGVANGVTGAGSGGIGGSFVFRSGQGNDGTGTDTYGEGNIGGNGGGFTMESRQGGNAQGSTTLNIAGNGGDYQLSSGKGGEIQNALSSDTAGRGGDFTITAGAGGHTRATASATAGRGGNFNVLGGNGGSDITSTGGVVAGKGGDITLYGGIGGTAASGGNGGDVKIGGGTKGSPAGATYGNVYLGVTSAGAVNPNVIVGTLTKTGGKLQIRATTEQVRTEYDSSNYFSTTVSSAGAVTLDAVGASAGFTFADSITLSTKDLITDTTTGTKIGTATGQKIAFHNSTPVIQRAGAAQVAVATTASTNVVPYGFTTAAQADSIVTLLNEIRAALVEKGLIKGAA